MPTLANPYQRILLYDGLNTLPHTDPGYCSLYGQIGYTQLAILCRRKGLWSVLSTVFSNKVSQKPRPKPHVKWFDLIYNHYFRRVPAAEVYRPNHSSA